MEVFSMKDKNIIEEIADKEREIALLPDGSIAKKKIRL